MYLIHCGMDRWTCKKHRLLNWKHNVMSLNLGHLTNLSVWESFLLVLLNRQIILRSITSTRFPSILRSCTCSFGCMKKLNGSPYCIDYKIGCSVWCESIWYLDFFCKILKDPEIYFSKFHVMSICFLYT